MVWAHVWALGYSLRNGGGPVEPYCPTPPEGVPLEVGFGYQEEFVPPAIRCGVNSHAAGWAEERVTVLETDFYVLAAVAATALICVFVLLRRGMRSRLLSD